MRREDGASHDGVIRPHWVGASHDEGVGPQGAALILELERLREAFEHKEPNQARVPHAPRPARDGLRAAARRRPRQSKQQWKGKVGRAIDVCLKQFGFAAEAPSGHRNENGGKPAGAPALRPTSPSIVPGHQSLINVTTPGPELAMPDVKHQSMQIESPRLVLPHPAGDGKQPAAIGQLIANCYRGLSAGVAFLVNPEGVAANDNAPGNELTE